MNSVNKFGDFGKGVVTYPSISEELFWVKHLNSAFQAKESQNKGHLMTQSNMRPLVTRYCGQPMRFVLHDDQLRK